jgi:hypothetical protein
MSRATFIVGITYSAWVVFAILLTVLNIGDGGIGAHLALIFTGLPSSILSLYVPDGTLCGVIAAGVLGCAQWIVLAAALSRSSSRHTAKDGA